MTAPVQAPRREAPLPAGSSVPGGGTRAAVAAVTPLVLLLVPVVAIALFATTAQPAFQSTVTGALTSLVMVVALHTFMGNSGVQSFGHVAFVAIGAYASAILTIPATSKAFVLPHLPGPLADAQTSFVVATLVSAALAAVVGVVASLALMRLSGTAAGIASFALLIIVQDVAANLTDVTGGLGTLTGVPTDLSLQTALAWTTAVMVISWFYGRSRAGARLRASRDDDVAARSLGVRVERERRIAFTLSAAMMGIAGSMYAHRLGAFGPGDFYIDLTFVVLAMLILGGTRSLAGAVVGTTVVTVVDEVLTKWQSGQGVLGILVPVPTGTSELLLAVVLLVVLLRRPDGLTGSREIALPRRWTGSLKRR